MAAAEGGGPCAATGRLRCGHQERLHTPRMGRGERKPRRRTAGTRAVGSSRMGREQPGGHLDEVLAPLVAMLGRLRALEAEWREEILDEDIAVARRRGGHNVRRGAVADEETPPQLDTSIIEQLVKLPGLRGALHERYEAAALLAAARLTPEENTAERHAVLVAHQMVELAIAQADRMSPGSAAQVDRMNDRLQEQIRNSEGDWPAPEEPGPRDRRLSQPEEEVRAMCTEFNIAFVDRDQAAEALKFPLIVSFLETLVDDMDAQHEICGSTSLVIVQS